MEKNLDTSLIPYYDNKNIKEFFRSNLVWDFLLFNGMIKHKQVFNKIAAENASSIKIGNITKVRSELYPSGDFPSGEIEPGSRRYRMNTSYDPADFYFEGDELDISHGLFIFTKGIRYGRAFTQLCDLLEFQFKRDLRKDYPPTLAYIGKLMDRDLPQEVIAHDLIVPVVNMGWCYVPTIERYTHFD